MIPSATPIAKPTHRAVIVGAGSIANAVAEVLANRGIETFSANPKTFSDAMLDSLEQAGTPATLVFNCWYPTPGVDNAETIAMYPPALLQQSLAAGSRLATQRDAAIINFAFLPAIYVGTELEDHVASLRGGITGVTRTLARKFGRHGTRVTCVQAGLVDMPETQTWVSDVVKKVSVPSKRWANPTEVAKFMVFLAADSLYTTGQTMIIDGGLTAGITGT